MIDMDNKKTEYDSNGFVAINEDYFINEKIFLEIESYFKKKFLKFDDKINYNDLNINFRSEEFTYNDVSYRGWSKDQILFRNQFTDLSKNNCLLGKRGVLNVLNLDDPVVQIIENKKITDIAKKFLNEDEIIFLNGSFATSYPENLGEGKRFHCDITAFNNNKKISEIIAKNKHVCNIMIFVTDVETNNAPMRVLPGSHKKYDMINKKFANSMKIPLSKSYVPQAHVAFDEILEDKNFEYLTGKKGSIVAMNSFCMHSATENFSKDKIRNVIILNYGPKNFGLFKRGMNKINEKKFYKFIKDKTLFEYNTIDYKFIKTNLKNKINQIKSFTKNFIKLNFIRSKLGKLKVNAIKQIYKDKTKKCLNIGSGPGWYHPEYITIDAVENKNSPQSIIQDLVKNPKLPFDDNSFFGIYSSHCLEHLTEKDLNFSLAECKRILKPNGALRISVPNIRLFFEAYEKNDMKFMSWIKDSEYYKYDSWLRIISRMIYEPVVNYLSDDELLEIYKKSNRYNDFCNHLINKSKELDLENVKKEYFFPDNHKNFFDEDKIKETLLNAGFKNIEITPPRKSGYSYFQNTKNFKNCFDATRPHMSLYVECNK